MLSRSQQLLLFIGLCLTVAKADVDCTKRPKNIEPQACCPLPDFVTPELKEKCQEYNTTRPPPAAMSGEQSVGGKRHHHHHFISPCLISCVFNETQFYEDNQLDENKLKDYLKLIFKDDAELQTLASDAFMSCALKIDDFKDKMGDRPPRPSPPPGAPRCPKRPAILLGCVFKNLFMNCPTSTWTDTQECNDAREFIDKCKRRPASGEN